MSSNEEDEGRSVQAEEESISTFKHQATTPLLLNECQSNQCNISCKKKDVGGLVSKGDSETNCDSRGQQSDCSCVCNTSSSLASSSGVGNVTDSVRDNASCKRSSSTITCEEEDENVDLHGILNEHEYKMDKIAERREIVRSSDEDDSPESKLLGTGNSSNCISKNAKLLNNENCKECYTRKTTENSNTKKIDVGYDVLKLEQDGIDICSSPSSDITEPELAKVNLGNQENSSLNDRKSCKDSAYSDSPNSEFECSACSSVASCADDSGISSTVRDEEMEEIPLADGSYSPNLFQEMSRISVDDMVSSWVPKSKNTYAPNITRKTSSSSSLLDNTDGRNQPQQTKIKELFSDSGIEKNQTKVGWKSFGKVPPKETSKSQSSNCFSRGKKGTMKITERSHESMEKEIKLLKALQRSSLEGLPKEITEHLNEDDVNRRSLGEQSSSSRKPKFLSLKRTTSAVPSSTTALIFENRPRNLPAKSASEEKKHRQQYEAMVAQARKKELQEAKKQEKEALVKNKQEKVIATAAAVWANEILPNWETVKTSRRARELWWQGIPPSVRGKVWKLAIGNDLQITNELFDIFQTHAYEKLIITRNNKKRLRESNSVAELPTNTFVPVVNSEHKVELIMLDVSRTFPSLCIFQEGGPFHDVLHSILGAYTCYRPDVGYVQGMSFIAAVLLLNMEPPDAFVCFANLLNKPCQLVFFRVDHPMMKAYFATFEIFLEEFLPKVGKLFFQENFSPDMYLIDWIFTLFSKSLPLDVACRVWDVFCRDGDYFLFRTALGILKFYQDELIGMDFIHLGQFLSKLPDDISANKLFDCISSINLSRQKFNQILAQQKELATQIKTVTASAGVK